jgi:hypothetical protein
MKSHRSSFLQFILLTLFVSALVLAFAPSARVQQDSAKVSKTSRGGLQTVTFDTLQGKVNVNLPDDIMAGDTISGTVVVEPKGQTQDEREKNLSELSGYVIELKPPEGSKQQDVTKVPLSALGSAEIRYRLSLPSFGRSGSQPQPESKQGQLEVSLKDTKQGTPGPAGVPPDFAEPVGTIIIATNDFSSPLGTILTSGNRFKLPTIAQQGRPVEIPGPFDGGFENTKVMVGGEEVRILAESPRKAVFESPTDTTGQAEIVVREGQAETKGEYRNLRLRLSAPKTNLVKGESTTLTVRVLGLEGLTQDVPLHLENASPAVVRMDGGDKQTFRITPSALQPDGAFTATRTITGQQAGSFSVTATVVVFNRCLQDDQMPASVVLWDTFTGDYSFCRLDSKPGSSDNRVRTDGVMDLRGGVLLATGDTLDLNQQGSGVLTFQSNNADRRVLINLSAGGGVPSGSATIETINPKQTFTIRDRDTRDNTCTCK